MRLSDMPRRAMTLPSPSRLSIFNLDNEGVEEDAEFDSKTFYPTFTSIDWLQSTLASARDRDRLTTRTVLYRAWYRAQDWVVISCIGIGSAIIAFFIIRLENFLADLKEGYCSRSWWSNRRFCCGVENAEEFCPYWTSWTDFLSKQSPTRTKESLQYSISTVGFPVFKSQATSASLIGFAFYLSFGVRSTIMMLTLCSS